MNYWRLAQFGVHMIYFTHMSTRFKYFPEDKVMKKWGIHLCDVGWQQTSLEEDYPIRRHPDGYYYTWETGRLLSEYQLCLIFSGNGIVEFERGKPIELSSGTILLLAPGQWHRCKPDGKTGWGTLWIGFSGKLACAIVHSIFNTDECSVRQVAKPKEFKYAAMRFIAHAFKNGETKPFSTIGELINLLGHLAEGEYDNDSTNSLSSTIRKAQSIIAQGCTSVIDFNELASTLGLTYDTFRHNFAADTGYSPLQFQLSERLKTAKNLVANTNLQMSEIASRTGFSSPAYFTRFFKAQTKMSPMAYRSAQSTQ